MAKLTDDAIQAAFKPHLQSGETLKNCAFGVKQPNLLVIAPLFALALIPGIIAVQMLTRNYLVGLTDKRLILLQVKSITDAEVKEVTDYALADFTANPAGSKTGALFTHITIKDAEKPFKAKFHRAFSKGNRAQAMAIAEAISG